MVEVLVYFSSKRTFESENSSFVFTVCIKSVPLYHFKLACVALHTAVKVFSKPTSKNGEIGRFNRYIFIYL